MISLMIALFIASQHPTHKNCAVLRDEMVKFLEEENSFTPGSHDLRPPSFDKGIQKIRKFSTKVCKDGIKRKLK